MKTIEDMFEKAFNIADNDPNAFVGVFCRHTHAKDAISQMDYLNGRFLSPQLRYESNSGGRVQVITSADPYDLSGCQFSHAFLSVWVTTEMRQFVRGRIRSASEHPVKMGIYHQSGFVECSEAW